MKKLSKNNQGFTVIELLVFILVLAVLAVIGVTNIRSLRAENRDTSRKTDINAVYYQLESFYEKNGYYPEKIDAKTLAGIDPESLKDTDGKTINEEGGAYIYKPGSCTDAKCGRFELSVQLEREALYVKQSLNN